MKKSEDRRKFLKKMGLVSLAAGVGTSFPKTSFAQVNGEALANNNKDTKLKIFNGNIITPFRIVPRGTIVVIGSRIAEVSEGNIEVPDAIEIDAKEKYVSPGFINLHIHGGFGHAFLDGSIDAFLKIAEMSAQYGTTAMYPTALSGDIEELLRNIELYEQANKKNRSGAQFLGMFLEGPYYSMENRGAQNPHYIRNPDPEEYKYILSQTSAIKRWDSAPELPGAMEFARYIQSKGVVASFGHTSAVYEDILRAVENGYSIATHLYSGMNGVTRRNAFRYAGAVESAYLLEGLNVEVIADGKHLPPALLKLIYKIKGADRIALVTDSMRAAGMPDGTESILGSLENGIKVIIYDGVAMLPDRSSFAGSVATTDRLVRTMVNMADVPLQDAVRMTSSTPATMMEIEDRKGSLTVGKDADIVIFDDDVRVAKTIIKGKVVYDKSQ